MVTTDLSSSFRSIIEKAGMQLYVNCPPLSKQVYADLEMWEKIILNLLSNAFKYTLAGSIAVDLSETDTHALLRVTDTGTGIPAKELPHMFERFHRVEQSAGRTHEGSGIGLSLVHELVQLHNGQITVDSELGKGSCFTVSIPLGKTHLPAAQVSDEGRAVDTSFLKGAFLKEAESLLDNQPVAAELTPAAPETKKDTILVVDDNADMRQYLGRILDPHYFVQQAVNGQDGLDKVQQQHPDLVLSDVMMPVMDGKGLLQTLKAQADTSFIPVILLSARAGDEARVDGLESGADDYLVKPFSAKELLSKIKTQIALSKTIIQRSGDLKSVNEALIRSNEQLREFTFISTHDLQEPLRKIQTFADLLLHRPTSDADTQSRYLRKIIDSASRMSALIASLLKYSRLDKKDDHFQETDLNKVVSLVISDYQSAIDEKNAMIAIEPLPVINALPLQMEQLFNNLIGNAMKFCHHQPIIKITATNLSAEEQQRIDGLLRNKPYTKITVQDNGIGFEPQYAGQIFTLFQRLVKTNQYEGTGIGLTICRKIVENHYGVINASSEPDKGSIFTIYLPVA